MTTFTGPLIVTSAAGDGSKTFKVSGDGQVSTDAGIAVAGALSAATLGITGDATITGALDAAASAQIATQLEVAGHVFAASAVTILTGVDLEASAGNAGLVPVTAAGFFELTIDSSAHLVPFFKVAT